MKYKQSLVMGLCLGVGMGLLYYNWFGRYTDYSCYNSIEYMNEDLKNVYSEDTNSEETFSEDTYSTEGTDTEESEKEKNFILRDDDSGLQQLQFEQLAVDWGFTNLSAIC
jgi:hypothetical protein